MARTITEEQAQSTINELRGTAAAYKDNPEKARELLDEAFKKARDLEKKKGPIAELINDIMTLYRMVKAYFSGEYKDIPWESIASALVALIYFASPIDLIPDFIPVVGYLDDALIVALVIKAIRSDLDNFRAWERR